MTASIPEAQLRAIVELATAMLNDWPVYEATEAALSAPTVAAAVGGGGRSSDVPDPVGSIVVSHQRWNETCAELTETLGHLRAVQRTMTRVRAHHPKIAREAEAAVRAARCSGAVDPTCTSLSVYDDGENAGLCWKCIKRRQRARKQAG